MTIEELKIKEREQYAEYKRLEAVTQAAGSSWLATLKQIQDFEQQAEVDRRVEERLASRKQEVAS